MIKIYSSDEKTAEFAAARKLAELAARHDPGIRDSSLVHLRIFPSAQCFGQRTKDIDLLVLFADYRDDAELFRSRSGVSVHSFCATIELKGHSPDLVRFEGAKCFVEYQGKSHNVTDQSERQKISVKNYIQRNRDTPRSPWIINMIWLSRLNSASLPQCPSNVVGMDVTWSGFLEKAIDLAGLGHGRTLETFSKSIFLDKISRIFSAELKPSKIDRKKMEAITRRFLDGQQYKEKLGEQLLLFRGRGGTGKTVRLLQIAYQAYEELGYRVLVLTYNKALVADISRTLALLRAKQTIGNRSIAIKSIYSFMHTLLQSLGVIEDAHPNFLSDYERLKDEALDLLKSGAITKVDIERAFSEQSLSLQWDLIMIDESQDWPQNEKDLLYAIFGAEKFVIADGVDQFVRGSATIDWREGCDRSRSQVVSLKKSLRLKASLCQTVSHLAEQLEYTDWNLEPLPETHGGKVVVVTGSPFSEEFRAKLNATATADGNKPIDLLLCVPPSWVTTHDGRRESRVGAQLRRWGFQTWDAVDPENRETFPSDTEQFRVVQYESCRGLEGWAVVCFALDEFYEHKLRNFNLSDETRSDLFFDEVDAATAYARKWLMIPLTRAIDTLVVHVSDEDSFVGKAFRELHLRYPEDVSWMSLPG